jgi:hypothetical protein
VGKMIEGKDVFGYCLVDNFIYIVGGRTNDFMNYSKTFERFSLETFKSEKL